MGQTSPAADIGLVLMSPLFFYGVSNADTVGFWTFDNIDIGRGIDQNAGFQDSSASGRTGILGMPFSSPGSAPGPSGEATDLALSLDGEAALIVDDSDVELLNVLEPPITIEAWLRSDNLQGGHVGIVSYGVPGGRDGAGGWKLGLSDSNLLFTTFGVVDVFSSVEFPADGEWHHVATVYSDVDAQVFFYVDGEELEAINENRPMRDPSSKELNIGSQYTSISRFPGDIDRVRISNAALATDELDTDAAAAKPVGANTLAYYDFDSGSVPYDSQGADPVRTAISLETWVENNVPRTNANLPVIEENSPSGGAGDMSLLFELDQDQRSFVADPNGILDFSDGDWTLEAWVSTDLPVEQREVIFYYGYSGHGYSLSINSDGRLQVTTLGIADMASTNAIVPSTFEWTHVAVSHIAGESINYFINGELIESRDYTGGTIPAEGGTLYIGAEPTGGLPYYGSVDRIRISNTALSAGDLDSNSGQVDVSVWPLY